MKNHNSLLGDNRIFFPGVKVRVLRNIVNARNPHDHAKKLEYGDVITSSKITPAKIYYDLSPEFTNYIPVEDVEFLGE